MPVRARCENDRCLFPKYANVVDTTVDAALAFSAPCGASHVNIPTSITRASAPISPKADTSLSRMRHELRRYVRNSEGRTAVIGHAHYLPRRCRRWLAQFHPRLQMWTSA